MTQRIVMTVRRLVLQGALFPNTTLVKSKYADTYSSRKM